MANAIGYLADYLKGLLSTSAETGEVNLALRQAGGANALSSSKGTLKEKASWSAKTLLFQLSATPAVSLYWPWIIKTDRITSPYDAYYCYFSTDHNTTGGVYLMSAPSIFGPWTSRGRVYLDTTGGNSTETPSVVWDDINQNFRMFYQQNAAHWGTNNATLASGVQSTLSCTSTDGVNWTKDTTFILDRPFTTAVHGNSHTGYFLPWMTKHGMFAYDLAGGTDSSDFILWKNHGPRDKWTSNWIGLGWALHFTQGGDLAGREIAWNSAFIVESGGVEFIVARLTSGVSGAGLNDDRIVVAPISADYRHIMERPTVIWSADQSWETSDLRSLTPYVENGVLYLVYSVNSNVGVMSHVL